MMVRCSAVLAAMSAMPAFSQAEVILTCRFGETTHVVELLGAGFGLRQGEEVHAAHLLEPIAGESIVALTSINEGGPVFLAIEAGGSAQKELQATMTMVMRSETGLASTTTPGTCIDEGL